MFAVNEFTGEMIDVNLAMSTYGSKDVCLDLWCEDGPYARLTVCLDVEAGEGMAYIDTNNCPWAPSFIDKYRIGKPTNRTRVSGFCVFPLYKLDMDQIRFLINHPDYEPEEEDFTEEQTDRLDDIAQKTAEYMEFMTGEDGFDSSQIMRFADMIAELLTGEGFEIYFPTRTNGRVSDIYPDD